ncbi:unnamed protein product, partial [Porites lobata]
MDDGRDRNSKQRRRTIDEQFADEDASNLSLQGNNLDHDSEDSEQDTSPGTVRQLSVTGTTNEAPSDKGEPCSCDNNGAQGFSMAVAHRTPQCGFCDGGATNISNRASFTTTQIPHVANVVSRVYSATLPSLPDSSLEDGESVNSERGERLDTGPSPQEKRPKENVCELSFQVPSPGIVIRIFLMEYTCPERNEKTFFLYLLPEEDCEVYEEICRELKEKEGFSRQVSFVTVDSRRSQDFYTLLVQEEIKVEFEIENIMQESFVTLNQGNESVFRVPIIKSESKSRLAKGSKCQFVVQYVGECGKACQEQGKATLTIDSTSQTTLFFSISSWVS